MEGGTNEGDDEQHQTLCDFDQLQFAYNHVVFLSLINVLKIISASSNIQNEHEQSRIC